MGNTLNYVNQPQIKNIKDGGIMKNKITNLRTFLQAYNLKKSDVEISHMLDISIDEVKSHRKEVARNTMLTKIKQEKK
ncbi:hypothetical protein [Clostridium aceticum]|nr:hypothetical protein [Clostridium aceticum]